jgi:hypothetical protein
MPDQKTKEEIRKCNYKKMKIFKTITILNYIFILVGTLFKKRFSQISSTVASNRIWLRSNKSRNCHVLITFFSDATYDTVFTLLDKILKSDLHVNVFYHQTTHKIALYITASYEK